MNNKRNEKGSFTWRLILNIVIALAIVMFSLWFFDNYLNGVLANWFEATFLKDVYINDVDGNSVFIPNMAWLHVRNFLVAAGIILIVVCIIAIRVGVRLREKKQRRQMIDEVSEMIHDFMLTDRIDVLHISKDYMEIENELLQIKAQISGKEQKLKDEAQRKNDLITYLAHDLKTPLTSVIGYLSLLDEAYDMPDDQRRKYVKITLTKAERLEKLTQEFFEITRYNLSSIILEKERFDMYYLFVQLIDEFYPMLAPLGKAVVLHANENLTYYGDPEKLARVFNNILRNAAAYSYENTQIHIFAQIRDNTLVLSFRNEGRQIPQSKLESIFDKFFRLDDARTSNTGGAGLGLAIAKEIVTLHDGTITASSDEKFTTFTVTLPYTGAGASDRTDAGNEAAPGANAPLSSDNP